MTKNMKMRMQAIHATLKALAQQGVLMSELSRLELTRVITGVVRSAVPEMGRRDDLAKIVMSVNAYQSVFVPTTGWCVVNIAADEGVWWRHDDGTAFGDFVTLDTTPVDLKYRENRAAAQRMLAHGRQQWGDKFAGVRVCAVSRPGRSLLWAKDSEVPDALAGSDLWFSTPIRTASELGRALMGGVA